VIGVQIEELAPRVRRTSDFSNALLESGLVSAEIVVLGPNNSTRR